MATNPGTQGAREVFGDLDIDFVKTVKVSSEYAVDSVSASIENILKNVLLQAKLTNLYLSRIAGEDLVLDDLEDE